MSRPRRQRISGIFINFNLALGLFRKEGNVLVRISMSPIIIVSCSFAAILQKNFLKFFSFVFLLIFPLFAVSSNKTNFTSNLFGKPGLKENKQTNKQTNKRTNKQTNQQTNEPTKQNKKQLIRFISPALPCGLPHSSLFICVFFSFV